MLCRRTEGWAAALRLAALSLHDHPEPEAQVAALSASDRTVADYLLGELLDRQPPDLRAFLLRTSIVDALTGDLADALTEGCDGAARLAELVRRNAMVTPLGGSGGWFTYHPLLRELLRAELSAQRREEPRTLHRRAASWLAAHGREREALRHARAADDPALVAGIVRDRWTELVVEGELGTVCELVDRVASQRLAADPEIALAGVAGHLATGRLGRADELLALAEAALPTQPGARFAGLHAAARLYHCRLVGADVATELQTLRELTRAPHDDPAIQALLLLVLGVSELWAAPHDEAIDALEGSVAAAVAVRRRFLQIVARGHLALALAFGGRMRQAAEEAEQVIALAAGAGDDPARPARRRTSPWPPPGANGSTAPAPPARSTWPKPRCATAPSAACISRSRSSARACCWTPGSRAPRRPHSGSGTFASADTLSRPRWAPRCGRTTRGSSSRWERAM